MQVVPLKYPHPSLIDQVTFVENDDGGYRAYLHASSHMPSEEMLRLKEVIKCANMQSAPAMYDGMPALEIRGFSRQQVLLDELSQHRWVSGDARRDSSQGSKTGFIEKVRKQSLFAAGLAYIIGDLKFISYGHKGKSSLNKSAGILYGAGTAANLLLGRKSSTDLKVHDLAQQMADYANEQKFEIPDASALSSILDDKHKGVFTKIDDYFRHFPAEVMNFFFAMAGICIAVAAYKQTRNSHLPAGMVDQYVAKRVSGMEKMFPHTVISAADISAMKTKAEPMLHKLHSGANWLDVGLGSMTFASGMFGALVQEKKHDPDMPRKEGLAGMWEWMQERPLTITGMGLMVSTMCHAVSTAIEYRIGTTNAKKAIFDRGVFVATNFLAEFLIAISSKGHGQGVKTDASVDDTAINVAAELIARQPVDQQVHLTEHMCTFLGRPEVLAISNQEVGARLQKAIEAMKQNPWAIIHDQPKPLMQKSPETPPTWQQKTLASQAVPPVQGL